MAVAAAVAASLPLVMMMLAANNSVVTALNAPTALPDSTRQALARRSKEINPPLPYATAAGWSNRAATVLTPVHVVGTTDKDGGGGLYTADRPFFWNKIDVGCRSTVIELPDNELFVHSPVALDGPMMECLRKLGGTVKYVFTPNYEHTKFASIWYQNYKSTAEMWGCPGISDRMPEIQWKGEIAEGYRPVGWRGGEASTPDVECWDTTILQPLQLNIEQNPFTGRPFFNEVIFYHQPSKTLLTTDLFWNYPESGTPNSQYGRDDSWELAPKVDSVPLTSRLWKFGMDQVYLPFFNNLMITNKEEYREIVHHILNVWDVETVIPAHGDILRGKKFIRDVLTRTLTV
jgi:Domain of unknown function (DUF4336)